MFSSVAIGLLMSAGLSAWVYSKMQRQTGGNTQSALTVAAGAGVLAFLFVITFLSMFS
ncbi:MAG: hypothetical protein JWL85_537 [Candidatus Saccharibacteria bacterium]|nr:hypothetical protein [Candidatus Saccharibacteria bacterium]